MGDARRWWQGRWKGWNTHAAEAFSLLSVDGVSAKAGRRREGAVITEITGQDFTVLIGVLTAYDV